MKVLFRNIHLYLSFAAGIIILCSCITGTILVFEKEINHLLYPRRYEVKPNANRLPLSVLQARLLTQLPKAKIASVTVYNDPHRSVEFGTILPGKDNNKPRPDIKHGKNDPVAANKANGKGARPNTTIFVNPYTGKVTGRYNKKQSFLNTVEMLHRFLLAGKGSIGDKAVGISTLLFLFILITGVILWWPKTIKIMRQRVKIKWGGSTKRLVHDLHMVTGFYTSIFLIVIVLTGLVMSFNWADKALYMLTGSKQNKEEPLPLPGSIYKTGLVPLNADHALKNITDIIKSARSYTIRIPKDSADSYSINVLKKGAMENAVDVYNTDQYTGKVIATQLFASKNTGQKLRAYVKPVHTGSIYGLPTKIISFIVCLLSTIFPVTGVMMWLNRTNKKKKKYMSVNPKAYTQ